MRHPDRAATPCAINPIHGLLCWRNTDRAYYPAAPSTSVFAIGMGTNVIWIDPALDLVVVGALGGEGRVGDLIAI